MLNQMYEQYCANRLPCGICRLTSSQCPKACGVKACGITVDWCKVSCTSTNPTGTTEAHLS